MIRKSNFKCSWSLKNLKSSPIVIYYVLYNNSFYTDQLAPFFVPRKDSYYIHNDTEVLFIFFFSKTLISFSNLFLSYVPFYLRQILILFPCFFPEPFLVFLTIVICYFHIEEKNCKKYHISFLLMQVIWEFHESLEISSIFYCSTLIFLIKFLSDFKRFIKYSYNYIAHIMYNFYNSYNVLNLYNLHNSYNLHKSYDLHESYNLQNSYYKVNFWSI